MCDKSMLELVCLGEKEVCVWKGTHVQSQSGSTERAQCSKPMTCLMTVFLKNEQKKTEWTAPSKRNRR